MKGKERRKGQRRQIKEKRGKVVEFWLCRPLGEKTLFCCRGGDHNIRDKRIVCVCVHVCVRMYATVCAKPWALSLPPTLTSDLWPPVLSDAAACQQHDGCSCSQPVLTLERLCACVCVHRQACWIYIYRLQQSISQFKDTLEQPAHKQTKTDEITF